MMMLLKLILAVFLPPVSAFLQVAGQSHEINKLRKISKC